ASVLTEMIPGTTVRHAACLRMNVHQHIGQRPTSVRKTGANHVAVDYALPVVFVLLWASGIVVPRAFKPYVEPFVFITARNAGAAVVLVLLALALRRSWPSTRADRLGLIWTGALLQGFFLMAGYWAIVNGLQVGVAALIAALQPGLTALFAAVMVGEGL